MTTIKSYTDIEQSKTLAEILPLESADMLFQLGEDKYADSIRVPLTKKHWEQMMTDINPCWSLAALLDVLPNNQGRYTKSLYLFDGVWHCEYVDVDGAGILDTSADNALDACCGMILKLHESKKK